MREYLILGKHSTSQCAQFLANLWHDLDLLYMAFYTFSREHTFHMAKLNCFLAWVRELLNFRIESKFRWAIFWCHIFMSTTNASAAIGVFLFTCFGGFKATRYMFPIKFALMINFPFLEIYTLSCRLCFETVKKDLQRDLA